jgi:hypothetical protein
MGILGLELNANGYLVQKYWMYSFVEGNSQYLTTPLFCFMCGAVTNVG